MSIGLALAGLATITAAAHPRGLKSLLGLTVEQMKKQRIAEKMAFERGRHQALGPGDIDYEDVRDLVDEIDPSFTEGRNSTNLSIREALYRGYKYGERKRDRERT